MGAFDEAEEILSDLLLEHQEQINEKQPPKQNSINDKLKIVFDYDARVDYLESQEALISDKIINYISNISRFILKSKNNKKAIEFLELAIKNKYKKSFKTRLIFILAQLSYSREL